MSLQWTLVASFLYFEIGIVVLLSLPFIPARKWQVLFRSRFLQVMAQQAQWYFGFLVFVLVLFLLDAIREIRKYSNKEIHDQTHHLESELQYSMRMFRAQRNFYISGFALFLSIVIHRLVKLISAQATLQAEKEAALKQAQSASTTARTLMNAEKKNETAQNASDEAHQEEIVKLSAQISLLEDQLEKVEKDKAAIIEQNKGTLAEYDRLSEEHSKLQRKLKILGDGAGDKKGD